MTASAPGGTSRVITEPAPTYAPSPTVMGATRLEFVPMKAPVADDRLVLVHAVVVARDGARAEVHVGAQRGVADVGEMRHLGAAADLRLLQLDEVADLRPRADMARRAQVAEGSERHVVLHHRLVQDAVGPQRHAVAEAARAHAGARAHDALGADHRVPLERDAGIEDGVGADLDRVVDIGARGIEHGDAVGHQPVQDAPAHDPRHVGELLPVVHAEALAGVLGDHRVEMVPAAGRRISITSVR